MVNPKSLENLKTPPPGQSANPSGNRNQPRRIPVQNSLNRVLEKIEPIKDFRGKGPVIDRMLLTWCKTWVKLCDKAKSAEEFSKLTDSMIKMQAIADDKELPPTVELTGGGPDPSAQTKATKTSTVVLQGGEIVKQEETRTVTQTVAITGANDDETSGTDHGPKRGKGRARTE